MIRYDIIPTPQAAHFGRVYAVYGGFFIVLLVFWGGTSMTTSPTVITLVGVLPDDLLAAVSTLSPLDENF